MWGERGKGRAARALIVAALALGTSACTPFDDLMVAIFGRSMRDQPSFDPYENPRLPAEGAVPFASGNYPAEAGALNLGQAEAVAYDVPPFTAGDMGRGGGPALTLRNPVPATPESLARGQLMYDRYCAVCHGPQGVSADAPIIEKHPVMQAFNLASGASTGLPDGYLYGMIRVGRGLMPAYGHQIPHFDRWHIVNYVRQLQGRGGGGAQPAAGDTASAAGAAAPAADTAGGGD